MSIVANSPPLINLVRVERLELLHQLYSEITVPEAVWREVVVEGAGKAETNAVKSASWIKNKTISNKELVRALQQELDPGEAEAIALAVEIGAELLLMDNHLGRETASADLGGQGMRSLLQFKDISGRPPLYTLRIQLEPQTNRLSPPGYSMRPKKSFTMKIKNFGIRK